MQCCPTFIITIFSLIFILMFANTFFIGMTIFR